MYNHKTVADELLHNYFYYFFFFFYSNFNVLLFRTQDALEDKQL